MQAVQALHACLIHDTVDFVDESKFQRLLPALVLQLGAEAPAIMTLATTPAATEIVTEALSKPAPGTADFARLLSSTLV